MNTLRGVALIVRRSLRQHALSTLLTAASIALGCGLLMTVINISAQTRRAFTSGNMGFDAVLGARGSKLQLVLNSLFHLEQSTGNIPWSVYRQVRDHVTVSEAIPLAVGDNFQGFRIVGTTQQLFARHEYQPGRKFQFQPNGRVFTQDAAEAVIGSFVARHSGLKLGSEFHSYHGVNFDHTSEHDLDFTVVGVLEPTNTPVDRAIWIPIEGYYRMPGHALRGAGENYIPQPGIAIPDKHKQVSAVLLKFKSKQGGFMFDQKFNRQGNTATLAFPIGVELNALFEKFGWAQNVLTVVCAMVLLVAAVSILGSIYNTMNERRREFAILRALGARRATVFGVIVTEAAAIAGLGALAAFGVYGILMVVAGNVVRAQTGIVLYALDLHLVMLWAPVATIALGALTGVVPAVKAYTTDVATYLAPVT